ncbi:MAG: hypothetical protein U0R24_01475 [Solirubrobacterales bacterium]
MRTIGTIVTFFATIVAAALMGFGVPLAWIWIGSQLQGDSGATTTSFSVAMAIIFGIIATYVLLLYLAGIVMALLEPREGTEVAPRAPWMRGQTETRPASGRRTIINGVERLFVVTTIVVTIAFWLWFAFKAGSPLPNQ